MVSLMRVMVPSFCITSCSSCLIVSSLCSISFMTSSFACRSFITSASKALARPSRLPISSTSRAFSPRSLSCSPSLVSNRLSCSSSEWLRAIGRDWKCEGERMRMIDRVSLCFQVCMPAIDESRLSTNLYVCMDSASSLYIAAEALASSSAASLVLRDCCAPRSSWLSSSSRLSFSSALKRGERGRGEGAFPIQIRNRTEQRRTGICGGRDVTSDRMVASRCRRLSRLCARMRVCA